MKNILLIALAFISIEGIAQQKMQRTERTQMSQIMRTLTPEESAGLETKRMTLSLDLNPFQQEAIYKINLENASNLKEIMANRKSEKLTAPVAPSKEAFLKMSNDKLDYKIATKIKMNYILNADQRAKWEKNEAEMTSRFKKGLNTNKKFVHGSKSFNKKIS